MLRIHNFEFIKLNCFFFCFFVFWKEEEENWYLLYTSSCIHNTHRSYTYKYIYHFPFFLFVLSSIIYKKKVDRYEHRLKRSRKKKEWFWFCSGAHIHTQTHKWPTVMVLKRNHKMHWCIMHIEVRAQKRAVCGYTGHFHKIPIHLTHRLNRQCVNEMLHRRMRLLWCATHN